MQPVECINVIQAGDNDVCTDDCIAMNKSQRQTTNINLDRSTSVPSPALNGKKKNDRLTFVDFSPQTNSSYVKSLFSKTETYG